VTKNQRDPQRQVRITQPERVKVPTPPIVGKKTAVAKTPPRPANERTYKGPVKDMPRNDQPPDSAKSKGDQKAPGKEKDKNKDRDKGHDKR
jgi:hypothetical protein